MRNWTDDPLFFMGKFGASGSKMLDNQYPHRYNSTQSIYIYGYRYKNLILGR